MTTPDPIEVDRDAESQFNVSSRARLSKMIRDLYTESARTEGDENGLWLSAASHISAVSTRFHRLSVGDPMEPFEWDMHDMWHLYIHASMNINYQRAEQDRLIVQILQMRELGVLVRRGEKDDIIEEARTSGGRIWEDLPFLVSDMTYFWLHHSGDLTPTNRQNLSSFLAKLCSVGVGVNQLCGIALIMLRDALESDKSFNHAASQPEMSGQHSGMVNLLLAANCWLFHASQKMIDLSDNSVNAFVPEVGKLGELAKAEGVIPKDGGFSAQRWLFWFKRLEEIASNERDENHGPEVREVARGMLSNMKALVCESDSSMKRELERSHKLPIEGLRIRRSSSALTRLTSSYTLDREQLNEQYGDKDTLLKAPSPSSVPQWSVVDQE